MTQYADTDRRALTDEQLDTLKQLEGDVGQAVDRLLQERGLSVRVSSIQLVPREPASAEFDDDPTTKMPPPGGVYICWQEVEGGPWICVCGAPEVLTSGG